MLAIASIVPSPTIRELRKSPESWVPLPSHNAARADAQASMRHCGSKTPRSRSAARKKEPAKKPRILAATSEPSSARAQRYPLQAYDTAEAKPLELRVQHAEKTAKEERERGSKEVGDFPDRMAQGHKEQGNGQQPSRVNANGSQARMTRGQKEQGNGQHPRGGYHPLAPCAPAAHEKVPRGSFNSPMAPCAPLTHELAP